MSKIILTTESGADVPKDLAEKYGIRTVPMHVIMEDTDYLDGHIPVTDIYDYYERTKKIPSTTSTNASEYEELFTNIREEHPDSVIIHVGYTSRASSSFQNATIAAKEFKDIILIDALNVTGGLAAVVLYAAKQLEKEPEIEPAALAEKIEAVVPKARLTFVPGSLEFLRAGGRVSNAAYLGGSLLKIKPLIELVDGKLVSTKKYRGKIDQVTPKLIREYFNRYDIREDQIYLIYSPGFDEELKDKLEKLVRAEGFENILWMQAGGVISTHAGPGGFGIAGLEK